MEIQDIPPMMLRIPICPQCNETDEVKMGVQLLVPTSPQYYCSRCKIRWWTDCTNPVRGVISDEQWNEWKWIN